MSYPYTDGQHIRMIATPAQTGVVHRCHPLAVEKGVVVDWNAGPMYEAGYMMAYFGANFDMLEPYTP